MIARSRTGAELLAFVPTTLLELPQAERHIPITWAIVVSKFQGKYLLMHNRHREQWEVPGGGLEAGETLEDCARRELLEESGQTAGRLIFRGFCKIRIENRLEFGAIFQTELDTLADFAGNDESVGITLWLPGEPLDPPLGTFSEHFIAFCERD